MVVASRFPELFARNDEKEDENAIVDDNLDTFGKKKFDMNATRTKLSTLFHRVSDVCTAEFELIAHVFGSEGNRTDLLYGSEEMPLVVARALLQRVVLNMVCRHTLTICLPALTNAVITMRVPKSLLPLS